MVVDANGDIVVRTLRVGILDDGPVALLEPIAIHAGAAEDALSTKAGDLGDKSDGNLDAGQTAGSDETSGAAGSLNGLFKAGADAPLTFGVSLDTSGLPTLYSHGIQLVYSVDAITNTLTATAGLGGTEVFTLQVNPDGSWTFDLDDQLDHVAGSGDSGTALVSTGGPVPYIDFSSIVTATDADGDKVTGASTGAFTIAIENDVPIAAVDANGVDEGSLLTRRSGLGCPNERSRRRGRFCSGWRRCRRAYSWRRKRHDDCGDDRCQHRHRRYLRHADPAG